MKSVYTLIIFLISAQFANAECISFGTSFAPVTSNKNITNNKLNSKPQVNIPGNAKSPDCLTIKPEDPDLYSAIAPKLPEKVVVAEAKVTVPGQDRPESLLAQSQAVPAAPITPVIPTWKLRAGKMIGAEIQEWAIKEKCSAQGPTDTWKVVWQVPKDWDVAANATFKGDFKSAAAEVINSLAENGALIRADVRESNCTVVVSGPGVAAK